MVIASLLFLAMPLYAGLSFKTTRIDAEVPIEASSFEFEYEFTNDSNNIVNIEGVSISCQCATVNCDKEVYAPGEKGKVKGVFTVGDRFGIEEKSILLKASDEEYFLTLKLTIPNLVKMSPKMLVWKKGENESSKKIRIETAREYRTKILDVKCDNENFEIKLNKLSVDTYELSVNVKSTADAVKGSIILTCEARNNAVKDFTIYLYVK